MDENCLAYGIEISDSDWDKTPASVKQLVEKMGKLKDALRVPKSADAIANLLIDLSEDTEVRTGDWNFG